MEALNLMMIISVIIGTLLIVASMAIRTKRRERANLLGRPEPIDQEELDWSRITMVLGWIFMIFAFLIALLPCLGLLSCGSS